MNPTVLGALIAAGGILLGSVMSAILNHIFTQRQTRNAYDRELRKLAIETAVQSWRGYHSRLPASLATDYDADERFSLSFHLRECLDLIAPDTK